ncbi:hypothetical protein CYMTET_54861 [Cymbomonas tetramitiformis]|uniref:Uncharacterized protein n=1 Tax=Cymbomonas tetramitiformis TaxID=36881 RepID=A0AAE0ENB7_9CHLO|nr:hypothetical protein CYMTET_54861 [Cymbomonas tetramitiformis]
MSSTWLVNYPRKESFSLDDIENDLLAEQFQVAMVDHDGERFDALCLLAGGKPEMLDGVSACAFGLEPEREDGALQDFLSYYCQPVTHMGGFTVGGVMGGLSVTAEGKALAMRYMHAESETGSYSSDVDESAAGCDPADSEDAIR